MEGSNDKSLHNNEQEGDIIQYLRQKYGLVIDLQYGLINHSKMELIKHDLSILENTQIGKNLFKVIGHLTKVHTECVIQLTSSSGSGSAILNPKKKETKLY